MKRCRWCAQDKDNPRLTIGSDLFGSVCCYQALWDKYASVEYSPAKALQEADYQSRRDEDQAMFERDDKGDWV